MRKPCFFHNAIAASFVLTTTLNCIAEKPSLRASSRECLHINEPTPRPRSLEDTM